MTETFHAQAFGGRSLFLLRVHFPAGSPSPKDYFASIGAFPSPWIGRPRDHGDVEFALNPEVPQLPAGAQFALIRRLAVIDRSGHWRSTPITLSIQLRAYRVTSREEWKKLETDDQRNNVQNVAEFDLDTDSVGAGKAGQLRAVLPDEKHYEHLFVHSGDFGRLERGDADRAREGSLFRKPSQVTLKRCVICHSDLGLKSFNSLLFGPHAPFSLNTISSNPDEMEVSKAARWKTQRVEWGILEAFWPR